MTPPTAALPSLPAPAPVAPRRRSRAKPKPPRPRVVVMSELRGLGGLVLEQALLDRDAEPQVSLVVWANRLAAELDVEGAGSPPTYRELMQRIVLIHRRALADPERPMVALPPAPR
ncbi:hypothetical protein [Miltoncostaea marina]|uniref:hypothetical protein n=1 Tax=Miltoncostaea marina TaxID=2843215 RepID=UPI001C3DB6A5|nr:hypothetical protein [Miltoncostaea marina]